MLNNINANIFFIYDIIKHNIICYEENYEKILIITSFLILTIGLLFFNGFYCDVNSNFDFCEIEYTPVIDDTEGIIQSDKTLEVQDSSDPFDFTTTSIHIFKNLENEGIPYVDAEEFLYVLHEGLQYYHVSISDEFSLTYKVNYSILPFNRYTYELDLNAEKNTIFTMMFPLREHLMLVQILNMILTFL